MKSQIHNIHSRMQISFKNLGLFYVIFISVGIKAQLVAGRGRGIASVWTDG